jgi:hypothetical protein
MEKYLEANKILFEDLEVKKVSKKFRFGPSRMYVNEQLVSLPITIVVEGDVRAFKKIFMKVYVIDCVNLPMLCGKNTLEEWNISMDMRNRSLFFKDEGLTVKCDKDTDHFLVPLYKLKNWNTDETVYLINKEDDVGSYEKVKKIHEATNHSSVRNLLHAFRNAGMLTDDVRQRIEDVVTTCKICQKYGKSESMPKVSLTKVSDFNQVVSMDLKQFGKQEVLWMICSFTRFCQGTVLKDKTSKSVMDAMVSWWCWRFGYPSTGFWADNRPELKNKELEELAPKIGFKVRFGPTYSPWSNGLNERNHYSADVIVKKIMAADKKITLHKAVEMAAWTHNTNTSVMGFDPMSLVTGKSVIIPGISGGNEGTDSAFDSENVLKIMERHFEMNKLFQEVEYSS